VKGDISDNVKGLTMDGGLAARRFGLDKIISDFD
jgi:hypothetical protein